MLNNRKLLVVLFVSVFVTTALIVPPILRGEIFFGYLFQIIDFIFFKSDEEDFYLVPASTYTAVLIFNFLLFYFCYQLNKLLNKLPTIFVSIVLGIFAAFSYTLLAGSRGSMIPGFSSVGWPIGFLPADMIIWSIIVLLIKLISRYIQSSNRI